MALPVASKPFGLNKMGKAPMAKAPEKPAVQAPMADGAKNGAHEATHSSTNLVPHGDGSYHTEHSDGQQVEHPTLGHALMHAANHHEPGGKHMHIHHDGMSPTSHGIHEDGTHDGPHEHADNDEMTQHVGSFFDDGEQDQKPTSDDDQGEEDHESLSGLGA